MYIYEDHEKILIYDILDKKLKFENKKLQNIHFPNNNNNYVIFHNFYYRIFVTRNYIFLYEVAYVLIFFKDLTFFRRINFTSNKIQMESNGFFVQDNVIYLVNDKQVKIYQLC